MSIKGICGNETGIKQEHFKTILKHHIDVVQRIFIAYGQTRSVYRYIDVFGGPGYYEGIKGSPVIFQEAAQVANLSYLADVIEIDEGNYELLRQYIRTSAQFRVHLGANSDILPHLIAQPNQYGLIYFDPPQDDHTVPLSFELMRQCAARWKRIDLMLYMSPALLKRARTTKGYKSIREWIDSVGKDYWIIRRLIGRHQWTFLIGTNYDKWAIWKREGFYLIDSPEGQIIFDRANLTKEEFKKKIPAPAYRTYAEYLQHPKFRAIRAQAIRRAGGICEKCRRRPVTEVHHLRYPPWGTFDVAENLLAVCHQCHCEIHGKEK